VNLTEWAHVQGIRVQAACRWYREGMLPVPAQNAGCLILVSPQTVAEAARNTGGAGLDTRVSWPGQRPGLSGPVARLSTWAAEAGRPAGRAGSGVNGARAKARRLRPDPAVTVVAAGHRDRPGRVNTELAGAALAARNRRPVVPGDSEVTGDLVRDLTELLASFCARFCGRRSARNRALGALGCARQDIGPGAVKLQICGGAG
jgi:putative resolvase